MKCESCRSNTRRRIQESYHYTECGLENIYLKNVTLLACEQCGEESLLLSKLLALHETIARGIALQPCALRGPDIRFLRRQLGYSAKRWASFLRIDISTLSRWENSQQEVGPQSDALIRLLYFRLLDESKGRMTADPVAAASVAVRSSCSLKVCVDMHEPSVFSYLTRRGTPLRTSDLQLT